MNFRPVLDDDPMLGGKFLEKKALYAIRPPAGWKKGSISSSEKALQYAARFQNPQNGDFMTVGLIDGGPKDLSIEALSLFRGNYLVAIRNKGLGKILGSDLFRFNHFYCVQVMAQKGDVLFLQLLIFEQPGSFLQLAFTVGQGRYHGLARTLEASIASLEWPVLES